MLLLNFKIKSFFILHYFIFILFKSLFYYSCFLLFYILRLFETYNNLKFFLATLFLNFIKLNKYFFYFLEDNDSFFFVIK